MTPHQQPETRGRKRYGHPINIHPLCCKNCICFSVINQTNYCSSLDGVPRFISRSQIYFIERVGCASHTPAAPATEPKPLRYSGVTVFTPPELSRHDAATRKAAREQVLDELLVGFKSNKNIICWLKGPTCAFPEITCRNCIIQHLESLRGGD